MSQEIYHTIAQQFAEQYGTTSAQMFGKPSLKTNNKAFAAFYKDAMVFKLGKTAISTLTETYPNAVNWDPSGKNRPMKDWLQVEVSHSSEWEKLAQSAFNYVNDSH